MFLKVFKYDFISVFKKYIPILIVIAGLSIVVRLMNLIPTENHYLLEIVIVLLNVLFVFSFVIHFVYTMVIVVLRYAKSLFKDQGYLTHTLPVGKHKLLLSQLLVAIVMVLIAILVTTLCVFIAYFKPNWIQGMKDFINLIFGEIEWTPDLVAAVVLSIVSYIVSSLQSILIIYLGIALGHIHAKNKSLMSVVYCIAINYALGLVLGGINIVFTIALFTDYNALLITSISESVVLSVAAYFVTIFIMERHLNLE